MKPTIFDQFHPIVPALYFLLVICCGMAFFHPLILVLSLVLGVAYHAFLKGFSQTIRSLAWLVPMLLLIMVLNPLFNTNGSTELFAIWGHPIYLEAVLYGACMGCMLVSMVVWFFCAAEIISSDTLMTLVGKRLPSLGLMLSMTTRMLPSLLRQGSAISAAQNACTAATTKHPSHFRQATVLMGWSLENSLETSDSIIARGWGATPKRTSYTTRRFQSLDMAAVLAIIALALCSAVLIIRFGSSFTFYPCVEGLLPLWAGIPYAILLALPLAGEAVRSMLWRT